MVTVAGRDECQCDGDLDEESEETSLKMAPLSIISADSEKAEVLISF